MSKHWILIILVIFLSACTPLYGSRLGNYFRNQEPVFGRGINIEFLPEQPPDEIYEGSPFSVNINMVNYATTHPISGEICISDTLSDTFAGIAGEQCHSFYLQEAFLESDEKGNIRRATPWQEAINLGTYEYNNIPGKNTPLQTNFILTANYQYTATLSTTICLSNQIFGSSRSSRFNCPQTELIRSTDFGIDAEHSPVTIQQMKKIVQSGKDQSYVDLLLEFLIVNRGGGIVVSPYERVSSSKQEGPILLTLSLDGEFIFECTPYPDFNLYLNPNGETNIVCRATVPIDSLGQNAYLEANLQYGYSFIQVFGPVSIFPIPGNIQYREPFF